MQAQRQAIEAEAERRGWQLVHSAADVASGRSTNGRPGLADAISMIEHGDADALVVAKLDRLSRSLLDFAHLMERAQRKQWEIVVLDQGFDMTTTNGRAMAGMLAVFAQWEREVIGQRTKDALAVKKSQGVRLGHPPQPVAPDVIARIRRERAAGRTLTAIADGLNADGLLRENGVRWRQAQVGRVLTYDPPTWEAAHQPMPVAVDYPTCGRCSRRAVAKVGDERLCRRHHELVLRESA